MKRITRYIYTVILALLVFSILPATVAYAIDLPDSEPSIIEINVWRNILEDDDFFIIVYENTPYADTPALPYSEAFIWRLVDTDGTTTIASDIAANYNEDGYGYNVISFYFSADDAPTWGESYYIRLSGTPTAFTEPWPEYSFTIAASDYSETTDTDEVKEEIADYILELAHDLDMRWGLTGDYLLLDQTEAGTKLSIYGEAFFRTAIYGLQALAPSAFAFCISCVDTEDREWEDPYAPLLENQFEGTYLETAETAGEEFLEVDYNFMGVIITIVICAVIVGANWYLAGGNLWRGLTDCAAPIVIGSRLAMFGLGEVGLIAAVCWLYISAKIWKVI